MRMNWLLAQVQNGQTMLLPLTLIWSVLERISVLRRPRRIRTVELNYAKRYCKLQTHQCLLPERTVRRNTVGHSSHCRILRLLPLQNIAPYKNLNTKRYARCIVGRRSVVATEEESADWYMKRSTPRHEPEQVTKLRAEEYINGLNAGSFLFF